MKNIQTFESFLNEAKSPELLKSSPSFDGFIYKNHNYTMGLRINRRFFDNDMQFFDRNLANEMGIDWDGINNKINSNRYTEKQGNFAKVLWDNDNYVIVGGPYQSDGYLYDLHKHLGSKYKDYKADIIKNFSFNTKGQPVLGNDFMINGKIH